MTHRMRAEQLIALHRLSAWVVAEFVGAVGCAVLADAQTPMPSPHRLAAMKADYRRPPPRPIENPALVDLGRSLFWDSRDIGVRQDSVRQLPLSLSGLGDDRAQEPQ